MKLFQNDVYYFKPRRGDTAMAGTFSNIYIQIVFAVKGRENLIQLVGIITSGFKFIDRF